ncbi:hypothetical protein CsatB_024069 [Cannabis sativa]
MSPKIGVVYIKMTTSTSRSHSCQPFVKTVHEVTGKSLERGGATKMSPEKVVNREKWFSVGCSPRQAEFSGEDDSSNGRRR